ncbi:integrin beta-like protein E [Poecilia reticulata]|uniref:integrin beta-like protein E n=1 Tax=Poecilia reticulata TaxID=8081 RepID=UPI0007E953B6|nr:PREDICTED: integrin beta-like protein E [Poecilia reticulata]
MLLSVLLLLLLLSDAQSTHFRGTMVTYYPMETNSDGSISVILRFKFNHQACSDGTYACTGNCGNESTILVNTKIEQVTGSWCQSEKITTRRLPNNSPLQLVLSSTNWFTNLNGIVDWRAVADVELRQRSDTNKPNSSPQTTVIPALRVPSNCAVNIPLLAFDPDGDQVQCRYSSLSLAECASPCTPPPVLSLTSTCILSFKATSSSNEGWYVVQMVMEDFPRQSITLTQYNGSQVVKTTSDAISNIPIQFPFQVDPAVSSCTEGYYRPRFVSPTPEHGAQLPIFSNQSVGISVQAEATNSVITELLFSGPNNVVKTSSGSGSFTLTWKPSASDEGQSHPICFVVQANVSTAVYQSALRCVVVNVTKSPIYIHVLRMKISTTLSIKDNKDAIQNSIKEELKTNRGFPPFITVRLLSDGPVVTAQ